MRAAGQMVMKALPLHPVAPERILNVLPELEREWSARALELQQRAQEAADRGDHFAAQRWTWCAGVATDKTLLLKGRPTEITGHLHAHRHDLGDVMDKLASAARRLTEPIVGRVAHSHQVGDKVIQVIEARAHDASLPNIDAASSV